MPTEEQEILEQIGKIALLKIKTIIVKALKKEDILDFEKVAKEKHFGLLLAFAKKKVPNLSSEIQIEMKKLGSRIAQNYD